MSFITRPGRCSPSLLPCFLVLAMALVCTCAATGVEYEVVSTIGSEGSGPGSFLGPVGIETNASGHIYVVDLVNSRVQVFRPSGSFLAEFGSEGSGPGEFESPFGIAINGSGFVYVTDTGNSRVQVFDASGTYLSGFGSNGSAPGEFYEPFSIAVDQAGTVYVADNGNSRVQVFTPSGAFVREFSGDAGTEEIGEPYGIAVSPFGEVYLASSFTNRVQVFSTTGTFLRSFPVQGAGSSAIPLGVDLLSSGNLLVTTASMRGWTTGEGAVHIYTPTGTLLTAINPTTATGAPGFILFDGVEGPDGHLYLTDYYACHVLVLGRKAYAGPTAGFIAYPETGRAPLTVRFQDTSTGAESWTWVFGDGTYSSDRYPVHVYTRSGTYTVSLLVSDGSGRSHSKVAQDLIRVTAAPPTADFTANRTMGTAPLEVAFVANTTGATSWQWLFGDGGTSTERDPVHVYRAPGRYTVWLVASAPGYGSVIARRDSYITIAEKVTVDFTANVTSGQAPLVVGLAGQASGGTPIAWRWEFGDGTNAGGQNTTHTYTKPGDYTVNLTAWTAAGSSTATKPAHIRVTADPRAPVANFSMSRTSGPAPLFVRFTDGSSGDPTSWRWDFGGLAWTTYRSPGVVFRTPGEYVVTLTVRNAFGSSSKTEYLSVTAGGAARTHETGGFPVTVVE
ncbi:MAG: PKD domain-containing protein [Methanoregulaceae archaeon]